MSEAPHEEPRAQPNIDDAGPIDAEVHGYQDMQFELEPAALELDTRIARTETARNAALVRRFRKIGLSKALAQYTILSHLSLSEGHQMTQIELVGILSVSRSDISRVVRSLVRDGLVRRVEKSPPGSGADRRLSHVSITEQGLELADRLVPTTLNFATDLAKTFTAEELQTLIGLLARLQARAETLGNS
jgi:DNA-binding MarR family transcriptional regulator